MIYNRLSVLPDHSRVPELSKFTIPNGKVFTELIETHLLSLAGSSVVPNNVLYWRIVAVPKSQRYLLEDSAAAAAASREEEEDEEEKVTAGTSSNTHLLLLWLKGSETDAPNAFGEHLLQLNGVNQHVRGPMVVLGVPQVLSGTGCEFSSLPVKVAKHLMQYFTTWSGRPIRSCRPFDIFPSRARSARTFFMMQGIKDDTGKKLGLTELHARWGALTSEERRPFEDMAAEDAQRYEKETSALARLSYKPPDPILKPYNAFRAECMGAGVEQTKEERERISARWREFTPEQKSKYVKKCVDDAERYEEQLAGFFRFCREHDRSFTELMSSNRRGTRKPTTLARAESEAAFTSTDEQMLETLRTEALGRRADLMTQLGADASATTSKKRRLPKKTTDDAAAAPPSGKAKRGEGARGERGAKRTKRAEATA